MSEKKRDKVFLAEHILEVRHQASGSFLDVRGFVADYIRNKGILSHWRIDANIVNFLDEDGRIIREGAFAGYKSAGYITYDPPTRNYFIDKSALFWKTLLENKHYKIPDIIRFGARTKIFVPVKKTFEEINKVLYETFFTENIRNMIKGQETDLQFVIELVESNFNARLIIGPLHKNEANTHFSFQSEHFKQYGLFMDLDYYKVGSLKESDIPQLLKDAINLTWLKAEQIASSLGF